MALDSETPQRIETLLAEPKFVLFLKGDLQQPACVFFAAATHLDKRCEKLATPTKNTLLASICHHGIFSRGAAERYVTCSFTSVRDVASGMETWHSALSESHVHTFHFH